MLLLRFKTGVDYVQQDSMAGRVQVPRWGLLRDLRDALLPVAVPHSYADLWHSLRPDTRARRIPCPCPYRPVLHMLLPRFHAQVARPFDQLTAWHCPLRDSKKINHSRVSNWGHNIHKPFSQGRQPLELSFYLSHRVLG